MQPFFLVIIKTSKHLFIYPLEFHEVLLLYTPLKKKYYLGEGYKGRRIGCGVRLALALWQSKQENIYRVTCGLGVTMLPNKIAPKSVHVKL